ncbi:PAS domain S-box-containing protein/diguanylate cyclase (GGDEF)-like protein [Saccharothrix australiensis]|uniref:PAS domain S-box-containing protein/diguanylate cyclase (GGDEF)-like protein n=2 Tax=Saccharothrix australiensis TaxID=2072 RepID=A0A495W3V3_9PSEU|nr:PAS domain S-box-containing protein/diguanylate cyclase (GGDEF)-like protein [Saccharothrix australiensis]
MSGDEGTRVAAHGGDAVGQRAHAESAGIVVQTAGDATIRLEHGLPDAHVRLVHAQADTIEAQRQLIDVTNELNDARRKLVESARVEQRTSQLIMVLHVVLVRLSALIAHLTGERDRYLVEAAAYREELEAAHRGLSDAERERGRAEGQLDQAKQERGRATAVAEAAHVRVRSLEQRLRGIGGYGGAHAGERPALDVPVLSPDDVLLDTSSGLDRVQRLLDAQEHELASLEAGVARPVLERGPGGRDPLTGLPDRAWFLVRLAEVCRGGGPPVGVCCVELDDFDRDDEGGREVGDRVLAAVARRLSEALHGVHPLARVGGAAFAVLVVAPGDADVLPELAARVRALVSAPTGDPPSPARTVSIGLVERRPSDTTPEELMREVEIALLRAKSAGGNRWVRYDPHDEAERLARSLAGQREARARMNRSGRRFADLVSLTPVGVGLFDEAERLVDANDALCDLLGTDLEQLRGRTAAELTHPDDSRDWLRSAGDAIKESSRTHEIPERILVRPDGERVYCELHIALSVQDDGRRFWLTVFQDITERRRASEALRHQATHDELTGLPNRALVKEMLARLLASEDRSRVAVLFCDIDNFKRVNDSLGHDAGDELLVALARRLEGGLPEGCTAARLSGDEYVIICEDIDRVGGVDALATRVAGLLRTAVPVHGQLVRVSASIGAAVPNGARATGNDLLRFADAAMFEAKRSGAGRVALASAALIASADRQVHLEGQLREALAHDGLALHFQPVVGVDGVVETAEALVRWPHPDRGLLPPDVFLPVAEQGDLLRELDRWVLRSALREAAAWPAPNGRPVSVAVNLAGLVPGDPEFVDVVADAIAEAGVPWDRVVLELVETALVDLPSRVRQSMDELVARGIRFAVDDFGTGYSSLARLKDLPAQIIKVDRRFVSGVGNDSSDFAVARAVVDMARAMGRKCVAEGVETVDQFHVLRGVGVDAYQGWLFSRPVPAGELRALLALGGLTMPAS